MKNNAQRFGDEILTFVDICDFEKMELQEGEKKIKMQIMKTGKFDHPFGKFEITTKDLKEFAEHFKDNTRRVDLAVDYSHRSDEKAAGWFRGISVSENGKKLFAEIEMTPEGLRSIQDKEFRFFSPEFSFLYTDDETGKKTPNVILGGGLTNRPFLKQMKAVVPLSEVNKTKNERLKNMDTISIEAHEAAMKILNDRIKELEVKAELLLTEQSNSVKLSEEVSGLKSEITKLQADNAKKEKENTFEKMLSDGKVNESQRVHFLSDNMEEFIKCSKPVNLEPNGSDKTNDNPTGDASTKLDEIANKLMSERKVNYSDAMKLAMSENKELAKQYEKEVEL